MSAEISTAGLIDRSSVILGIDVGGTKISAGLVAFPEGKLLNNRVIPTLPERGGEAVLKDVERLASDFLKEAEAQKPRVSGVGIGVCELVDRSGNIVSANCFDWRQAALRDRLSNLGPIAIEADVRAAALGEAHFGAGKPFKQFLYVTIGTGISCCLVLDGKPFTGSHGLTGTMASSPLPRVLGAGTGPMPTLEEVASGPALAKRFREAGGSAGSANDVVAAANRADQIAIEVVRSGAEALGASIGWLINVLDPEAVVLGGGLGLSQGLYRETMVAATRRHTWSELLADVPIVSAGLGANAGIIGAAAALVRPQGDPRDQFGLDGRTGEILRIRPPWHPFGDCESS